MLSAVLSVSVKRVRLIQGKVAGLPPSPVPALISLVVVLVHSHAFERHKKTGQHESFDRRVIMSGG